MATTSRLLSCTFFIALAAYFFIASEHPEHLFKPETALWLQEVTAFGARLSTIALALALLCFGLGLDVLEGNLTFKQYSDGSHVMHPRYTVFSLCMGIFLYLVSRDIEKFFSTEYLGLPLWPFIFCASAALSMFISFSVRFYYRTETH